MLRMFVSSTGVIGGSGMGTAGADAVCAGDASNFLSGNFSALLSDSSTGANSALWDGYQYQLVDGTVVATSKSQLLSGSTNLSAPIDLDASGAQVAPQNVWTGTLFNGTAAAANGKLLIRSPKALYCIGE